MIDGFLSFVTSEPAGIFALLFLNNILMYLIVRRHFTKVIDKLDDRHKLITKIADEHIQSLRGIVHAFSDEKLDVLVHDISPDDFDCPKSYNHGGKCYIQGEHVH